MPDIAQLIDARPWAITEAALHTIRTIYYDHCAGKIPDIKAIEAAIGRPLCNDDPDVQVIEGVAVIPVTGVIAKRMNLFMEISGGASIEKTTTRVRQALDDPQVHAIILKIDSPGGSVDGVFELAEMIFAARDEKDIVCVAYGMLASAAYLIGSAASAVYATDVATVVGSIGVVAVHRDTSSQDAKSGVVTTEIYRGKYKRIVGSGPLTEEGRTHLESQVDYFYTLFVDAVAKYRGVTSEEVIGRMSTDVNDLFIGPQAVEAGLIDGIMGYQDILTHVQSSGLTADANRGHTPLYRKEAAMPKDTIITRESLVADHPDLLAQILAEGEEKGKASIDVKTIASDAVAAERERVTALAKAALGDEAGDKFGKLIASGVDIETYKSIGAPIVAPQAKDDLKAQILAELKQSGADNPGSGGGDKGGQDWEARVDQYQRDNKCSRAAAIKAVDVANPGLRQKYLDRVNAGRQ